MNKFIAKLFVSALAFTALSVHADLPHSFSSGNVIYSQDMNENFEYVDQSERRYVWVDCVSDQGALQNHLNWDTSPSYVEYGINGDCSGGITIKGDYVYLSRADGATSASIKVPSGATENEGEAVYIEGSGYVRIEGIEIGSGNEKYQGIGLFSSHLEIREGTTINKPSSENESNAIYSENSSVTLRTDGGDIAVNGGFSASDRSFVYLRAEDGDITVTDDMSARRNSSLKLRENGGDISVGDLSAQRNSSLTIEGSVQIGNISITNGVVDISGDLNSPNTSVELYMNSSMLLEEVSAVGHVGVYSGSMAYINNSTFNGMYLFLGGNAYMEGSSKTTASITLNGGASEIRFASGSDTNYLNGQNLNLCNNTNYIEGYSSSGQALHGGVINAYTGDDTCP